MSIAAALATLVQRKAVAGALVVVTGPDRVLASECAGLANIEDQVPMQPDALFWIASISKFITGIALSMLIEEGKVSPDDAVERFIPEFKTMWVQGEASEQRLVLTRAKSPITVRQVMTHTSGLPFMSRSEPGRIDTLTTREAVISYAGMPLLVEPGTAYNYSNAGTNTAGRIIEIVSGQSYDSFLQERLLEPLGMHDTCMRPTLQQLKRLATNYNWATSPNGDTLSESLISQFTYPLERATRHSSPAGGYFSTARDMTRLGQMLLRQGEFGGRRYLKPESLRLMASNHTPQLKDSCVGLGVHIDRATGAYSHGGALGTSFGIDVRSQFALIYLVQRSGDPKDFPPVLAAVEAAFGQPGKDGAAAAR